MFRTRIKICGLTTEDQARTIAAAGADAVGLVFYEGSPRCVDVKTADRIGRAVGPFVSVVGLFVNSDADAVNRILQACSLDILQFHGDEDAAFCTQFGRPYIKAIAMRPGIDVAVEMAAHPAARGFLFDTYRPDRRGGTGESFAWERLPALAQPWVLAGGLTPDNVGAAIAAVHPPAVDVSGGVEVKPGEKDPARVRQFVAAVRAADERMHEENA